MNSKLSLFAFLILFSANTIFAEDVKPSKAPKQYSLEAGYRNVFYVTDKSNLFGNNYSHGYGYLFDYAWQLSGIDGKKPSAFISVPIGYSVMVPNNANYKQISMLNYGWTVRHELSRNSKLTPFLGYGLLLNTLKQEGILGGVMGHQTQFDFGANFNTSSRLKYFAKIECSYTSYPKLGATERIHFMFTDLRIGLRF